MVSTTREPFELQFPKGSVILSETTFSNFTGLWLHISPDCGRGLTTEPIRLKRTPVMQTLQWNMVLLNYSSTISPLQFFHSGTKNLRSALLLTLFKAQVRSPSHGEAFCFETVHSKNLSLLFFIFIAGLELIHYLQGELNRRGDISKEFNEISASRLFRHRGPSGFHFRVLLLYPSFPSGAEQEIKRWICTQWSTE